MKNKRIILIRVWNKIQNEQKWRDEICITFRITFITTSSSLVSINEFLTITNHFFLLIDFLFWKIIDCEFQIIFLYQTACSDSVLNHCNFVSIDILCDLLFLRFSKTFTFLNSCQLKRFEFSIWNFHNALTVSCSAKFLISSFCIVHSTLFEFHENARSNRNWFQFQSIDISRSTFRSLVVWKLHSCSSWNQMSSLFLTSIKIKRNINDDFFFEKCNLNCVRFFEKKIQIK